MRKGGQQAKTKLSKLYMQNYTCKIIYVKSYMQNQTFAGARKHQNMQ